MYRTAHGPTKMLIWVQEEGVNRIHSNNDGGLSVWNDAGTILHGSCGFRRERGAVGSRGAGRRSRL